LEEVSSHNSLSFPWWESFKCLSIWFF